MNETACNKKYIHHEGEARGLYVLVIIVTLTTKLCNKQSVIINLVLFYVYTHKHTHIFARMHTHTPYTQTHTYFTLTNTH